MALDYDGASNGLFRHLGKLIKHYDLFQTDGSGLTTDLQEILDAFQLGNQDLVTEGLPTVYEGFEAEYVARRGSLTEYAIQRLQDRASVLDQIGAVSTDINEILSKLIDRMVLDTKTVNASAVTIGVVTAAAGNTGNGRVLTSKVLDGAQSPGSLSGVGYAAHAAYRNRNSELAAPSETIQLTCIQDSYRDGVTEGSEGFLWEGGVAIEQHGIDTEGSGLVGQVAGAHSATVITNADFETFSSNVPTSWTLDAGTAGTHVFEETAAANLYHGAKSLRFAGGGAQASIQISQAVLASQIVAGQRYCVPVRIKADATIAAGTLTIGFEGTGYTPTSETVEVQTVQISGTPTGGSYTLTWQGQTTAAIAFDATSATVQGALRLLVGLESVVVATGAGTPPDVTHQVTFHGVQGNTAQLTSTNNLTGGAPVITHATTTQGVEGERINLPPGALPTTWSLRHFFVTMPLAIPANFKLVVKWTGTPTNAKNLYIDDLTAKSVNYGGGLGLAVVRGSTPWVRGDKFTFAVTNTEGVIQRAFRRMFGRQLPSSASPNIADALAT